ncbi:hypothetical protein TVAG_324770 [Trichomonas vaginalis G3]|uniref:Uncharacterized protein n=1 Tax=Trichomonas vaginalis (strain ATCC PRA-98 / G3) TaxID=412133 RepID=A2G026_TRIV3|nr:hypothetical protein TVAGG3_0081370 [Trichomonas vaginalis G3]EAX89498.1 hypothetical protein TVAG_324770 [Trichomonas vaginalis G3]KAI5543269.1 hypothetical protein TVAGG3_0081370 [Trichomonas vaginalis G3]|eukprot:XP_001302428.1 hypothetical protein [Trichomonas vaginalis G3]
MFFGIPEEEIESVSGLGPALSVAEMLSSKYPSISNAFLKYCSQLIENSIVMFDGEPSFIKLKEKVDSHIKESKIAKINELEKFADDLIQKYNKNPTVPELPKIAYMTYCVTSIHGPLKPEISKKLIAAQSIKPKPVPTQETTSTHSHQKIHQPTKSQDIHATQPTKPAHTPLTSKAASSTVDKPLPTMLADIAREAFKHHDADIAMAALVAAIKELEKQ